ncbi:MAG: helix-turn-helix domain-containing protein [candidate division WOR-3 bacterium]
MRGRQTYFCKRSKRRFVWGGKWNKYSYKWFYTVINMRNNGLSLREISRRTGIPFSTVRRFVKRYLVTIKTDQN